jgi:Cys-tRNA(Pro)/Cys-tRNA(Cys) deacylase
VTKRRAGTPALVALQRAGVAFTVHEIASDPGDVGYARAAAASLGVDEARVFKTLLADVEGAGPTIAVVPSDTMLDLKALARAIGGKRAAMAEPPTAERLTGYVVGGISPFGARQRLRTVVDERALAYDTVFVSAGRRGLDVEIAPDVLVRLTNAVTASIVTSR